MKFIFVPHPRSEDRVHQSVLPEIEKIDFSKYEMILLGGDLTYYTSINRKSMDYCDSLFKLNSPNTLWTMGNHDIDNRNLISEYTGKKSFYSYYRDSITFLVLDTELDADGFKSTYISGDQLDMIKSVCDTISKSGFLVVLHGRILWMIGNDDFKTRIDSVGESTRQLDTTNFYQVVYPLLQKIKSKGIQVICLGGDKSKINIEYSPEDSITFFTSTMAPEFTDSANNVMIFNYWKKDKKITWEFVPLDKVEKNQQYPVSINLLKSKDPLLKVWTTGSEEISIQLQAENNEIALIQIFSITGRLCQSIKLKANEKKSVIMNNGGIYIVKALCGNSIFTEKIILE